MFLSILIVVRKNFVFILANLDYVLLVVINIILKGKLLFFLNYLNLNIDMLFGLFLKNLEITLEKIYKDYHFYLKQVKSLLKVGFMINIKRKILRQTH